MDVVFALADRITVLVYGQVIASGSPQSIKRMKKFGKLISAQMEK